VEKGMKKKDITLVANMMVLPSEIPYLSHTLPALKDMCDRVVVLYQSNFHKEGADYIEEILEDDDTLITLTQREDDYSKKRNILLGHVEDGEWMLKWDPDELPTGGMSDVLQPHGLLALKHYIAKEIPPSYTSVGIPIFHLVKENQCLKIEYGMHHLRAVKKTPKLHWEGRVHEQPYPAGKQWNIPTSMGMGIIHLSYYSPDRLRRKEAHYSTIVGSGHGPGTLFRNIEAGLRELPPNMDFEASEEWLEMIRNLG
jgi:hypothetical protein